MFIRDANGRSVWVNDSQSPQQTPPKPVARKQSKPKAPAKKIARKPKAMKLTPKKPAAPQPTMKQPSYRVNIDYRGGCKPPRSYVLKDYSFIKGDGSCLFRSLVQAVHNADHGETLTKREEFTQAKALRKQVVEYIKRHPQVYENEWRLFLNDMPTLNQYAKHMSKTTTYADELEIQIASVILRRPICVQLHNGDSEKMIVPQSSSPLKSPLYLHLWDYTSDYAHYTPYLR